MTAQDEAKKRKETPLHSGVHRYFPAALKGVAKVSLYGSRQHHGTDDLYDDRSKSNDDADCLLRHLEDAFVGNGMDGDVAHIDKVAWRALRLAQKWHEARGTAIAPAATNVAKATDAYPVVRGVDLQDGRWVPAYDRHPGFLPGRVELIKATPAELEELRKAQEERRKYAQKAYDQHIGAGYPLGQDAE